MYIKLDIVKLFISLHMEGKLHDKMFSVLMIGVTIKKPLNTIVNNRFCTCWCSDLLWSTGSYRREKDGVESKT